MAQPLVQEMFATPASAWHRNVNEFDSLAVYWSEKLSLYNQWLGDQRVRFSASLPCERDCPPRLWSYSADNNAGPSV